MTFVKDPLNATEPREIIEYSQDLEDRIEDEFDANKNQIEAVEQSVTALDTKLSVDYVVEYDSNKNGSWEKWASGKLVQMGNLGTLLPTGGIAGNSKYTYDLTYPIPFISLAYASTEFNPTDSSGKNIGVYKSSQSTNTVLYTYIINNETQAIAQLRAFSYYAVGKWK